MSNKIKRLRYVFGRLSESPFIFLLHKVWILICKKVVFLPRSPLLYIYKKSVLNRLDKKSKSLGELEFNLANGLLKSNYSLSELKSEIEGGSYKCLGYGSVDIIGTECFHTDCIHGHTWNMSHFSKIDFVCSNTPADVKIPWEKSRLQWLIVLTTYYAAHDQLSQKKESILEHFYRWESNNKFLMGINWCSSMEVAIRGINLICLYRMLLPHLNKYEKRSLLENIAQHKIYLKLFPEISDIPGNHFLATEVGLFIIDSLMELNVAKSQSNLNRLINALSEQFNDDGMHIEYAPTYHRLCLDLVLYSYFFATESVKPLEGEEIIEGIIAKGAQALKVVSSINGKIALFGDNDSGQVLWFGQNARDGSIYINQESSDPSLASCNLLKSFLSEAFPVPFLSFNRILKSIETIEENNAAYPFKNLESGSFKLVTRIGKLGLGERGAHDHDDNLSYWLFDEDEDVIVEKGCAPYTLSIAQRESCISSSAHNVITPLNDERFSLVEGSIFKTVRGANVGNQIEVEKVALKARILTKGFEHVRRFEGKDYGVAISDKVKNSVSGVDYYLHLDALDVAKMANDVFIVTLWSDRKIKLEFSSLAQAKVKIENSDFYQSYGGKKKTKLIRISMNKDFENFTLKISRITI